MSNMEELYNNILNGEININHLSPIDLVKLQIYLEKNCINLNETLYQIIQENTKLENEIELLNNTVQEDNN